VQALVNDMRLQKKKKRRKRRRHDRLSLGVVEGIPDRWRRKKGREKKEGGARVARRTSRCLQLGGRKGRTVDDPCVHRVALVVEGRGEEKGDHPAAEDFLQIGPGHRARHPPPCQLRRLECTLGEGGKEGRGNAVF